MKKVLWIILIVVILGGAALTTYLVMNKKAVEKEKKAARNINVQALSGTNEKMLGTIIYSGAKKQGDIKTENNTNIANLTSTDSVAGASNIYYQDLLNRYKTYDVTKKEISKNEALDKKATVIVCTGQSGKITITAWGDTKGMTQIQIVTSSDFK